MSRRDLPQEVSKVSLNFDELLETFRQLTGDRAVLSCVGRLKRSA
jgi:hypothetical protein